MYVALGVVYKVKMMDNAQYLTRNLSLEARLKAQEALNHDLSRENQDLKANVDFLVG